MFPTTSRLPRLAALAASLFVAVLALAAPARPANAQVGINAVFNVNTFADTLDVNPGNGFCADAAGMCSLRAAIREANALAGPDVINLPPGLYALTVNGSGENASASGDLDITGPLALVGAGAPVTTIDASTLMQPDRVLHVLFSGARISGVTLTGGQVGGAGGGLMSDLSQVELLSVTITGNTVEPIAANGIARGGGIFSNDQLIVASSEISANSATTPAASQSSQGGGIYNESLLEVKDSSLLNNTASGGANGLGAGGGLYHSGPLAQANLTNTTVDGNIADHHGGGIMLAGQSQMLLSAVTVSGNTAMAGSGGGIGNLDSRLRIEASTVRDNTAAASGGGLNQADISSDTTIVGTSFSANQATSGGGIANSDGYLTVQRSRILDNIAQASGGGINAYRLDLRRSLVSGNRAEGFIAAGNGGGVSAGDGDVTIAWVAFLENYAADAGGGLYLRPGDAFIENALFDANTTGGQGGAIYSLSEINSWVEINRLTLSGNSAQDGGGLYIGPGQLGIFDLDNSTLSGNTAAGDGGGIFVEDDDTSFFISGATLTLNSAGGAGGGLYLQNTLGLAHVYHTLIAGNASATAPDCGGPATLTSSLGGYNLLGDDTGCIFASQPDDQVGTAGSPIDPLLGPLADNGGFTPTHALLAGSPAIDAGYPSTCPDYLDQRGLPQPVDGDGDGDVACDIGAFEKQP